MITAIGMDASVFKVTYINIKGWSAIDGLNGSPLDRWASLSNGDRRWSNKNGYLWLGRDKYS